MTLKEIAQEANVSISTVSRVINGKGKEAASQAVRDRIWDIVYQNNYTPNEAAKNLRMKQHKEYEEILGSIECFLARMPFSERDQFFSELAQSMEREALNLHYEVKYSFTMRGIKRHNASRQLSASNSEGIAVLGRCDRQVFSMLDQSFSSICYAGLNNFGWF